MNKNHYTPDTLSYVEIAYKILKEFSDKRPMYYREIANKAFEEELLDSNDLITAGNLSSAINSEIRKTRKTGEEPRFISYGKGYYSLTEFEPKGIFADIRNKNNQVKNQLLEILLSTDPTKFEEIIGEMLRNLGFESVEVVGRSGDGGIDVKGELVVGNVIRTKVCIQVKRWRNNIQSSTVAQLRGSLGPHEQGLIIATSDFSKSAQEEASNPYKAPIALMNGKELIELMCENGIGVTKDEVILLKTSEDLIKELPSVESKVFDENKGMEIFANYKGKLYYAIYFSPNKVVYNNQVFRSPSAAGMFVQNGLPVNGWRFWKYKDLKTGEELPLDKLRPKRK